MKRPTRTRQAGFTLMELMVVVAIIAMLAVFAMPKYTKSVEKTRMMDSFNALSTVAAQVVATCAAKPDARFTPRDLDNMLNPPSGARLELTGNTACPMVGTTITTSDNNRLCASVADGRVSYNWTFASQSLLGDIDLPVDKDTGFACPGA